jgi:hypothetical protein
VLQLVKHQYAGGVRGQTPQEGVSTKLTHLRNEMSLLLRATLIK